MIDVKKAMSIIRTNMNPVKSEKVAILPSFGRILANDIKSKINIPPFNNSAMDGFAINSRNAKGASKSNPKIFEIIDDLPAGVVSKKKIKFNQAIRIMTGAPLPLGADSVVKVEETMEMDVQHVKILHQPKKGENVRYAGEDIKKKDTVLRKGKKIGPSDVGMFAALGLTRVCVYRKLVVGILSTGDELVDPGKPLAIGKIRNSNGYSLYSAVLDCGSMPVNLGIVRDKRLKIRAKIKKAISLNLDMLLISGGVSVGDYDFVKDVLIELGADIKFWCIKMRPGKPLLFAVLGKVLIFGMPGNPVSSLICFEEFVRPAIMWSCGVKNFRHCEVYAVSQETIKKKKDLCYFLRVKLETNNGKILARLTGPQGSGILKSLVLADGIAVIPENVTKIKKGDTIKVQLIRPIP
ncbi:MAG TPA: molybdopterin molybdenumtransferase MoeA [Candidatus Omnitrophica bacterium]|nr:molybdopterin molybdenumtransferase MoeA [Candidatus Omnitrophota bacterium]